VKRIITFGLHYMEHGLAKIRDFSLAIVRSFVFYFWDRRAAKRSLDSNPQARIHVRHIAKPGLGRLARSTISEAPLAARRTLFDRSWRSALDPAPVRIVVAWLSITPSWVDTTVSLTYASAIDDPRRSRRS